MNAVDMFGLLLVGHALADYPLQGDFLSQAKNCKKPLAGVPWWQALGAHALIHAGFVGVITGSAPFACAEFIAHFVTDDLKCRGKISFNTDQAIHVICKLAWVAIAFYLR